MCLREKYFAKTKIKMSFMGSAGWIAKKPRSNHPRAPLKTLPTRNRRRSKAQKVRKRVRIVFVFRRMRRSKSEIPIATEKATTTQTNWCSK
jgi:hypothetical protein